MRTTTLKAGHGPLKEIPWEELTYKQQASSLNATILYLKKAISAHGCLAIKSGKNEKEALRKCQGQFLKLVRYIDSLIAE